MAIKRKKQSFVVVIPNFEDIFHSFYACEIIKGVSLGASPLKVDLLIHITDRFNHREWLDSFLLDKNYIDGILFADIDQDINVVKKVIDRGMPYLVLNNVLNNAMNYIAVDNRKAAFDLVEYLIKHGHTKIATIAGDLTTQSGQMRLEGYYEALAKHGIRPAKNYVTRGDFLRTPARIAAKKILNLKDRPTAIFAASDVMALELMDIAKELNISVPSQLSVIGFDDNPLNRTSSIKLTTVYQPLVEMGRSGLEHLYQISKGKAQLPVKILLPTKFVVRESTQVL